MKTFDEYNDGDWVVYINPGHNWHLLQFQAYKSKFTHNAFRLKYGAREVVADLSEIRPSSETNSLMQGTYNANAYSDLPRGAGDSYKDIQDAWARAFQN